MVRSLLSGAAGAIALTVVHETARSVLPRAPRVDRLGERLVDRAARRAGRSAPDGAGRYALALGGDLASNAAYYALAGAGAAETAPHRGLLLGIAAGAATVALPPALGLPEGPVRRTPTTAVLTVAWYVLGGLATGITYRALAGSVPPPSTTAP